MEAIAYGFGILPKEFWDLTFHEFFLLQRGRNEIFQMKERFEWERTRWLCAVLLQPHRKKGTSIKPTDLIKFEWEKKDKKTNLKERKLRGEYAQKKYEAIEKNKKIKD